MNYSSREILTHIIPHGRSGRLIGAIGSCLSLRKTILLWIVLVRIVPKIKLIPHVWFLGGSFGNESVIKRRCIIPKTRGIFFPIIEKEDSFVEDTDLKTEEELVERAKQAMDGVTLLEARIDGNYIEELKRYRVGSDFYDLIFPDDNVYDLVPGLTRSVCNGYWIFLKPLPVGKHNIYFHGECLLEEDDRANQRINSDKVYAPMRKFVREFRRFKVEVEYELTIQ